MLRARVSGAAACIGTPERDADGRLRQRELAGDVTHVGRPVPAGSRVTFGPHGAIGMASLSRASSEYGQLQPAGTLPHFADGRQVDPRAKKLSRW